MTKNKKIATKEVPQATEVLYKLTGVASFPFLYKTAKDEAQFPEDKHKIDVQVEQEIFDKSPLKKELTRLVREWFQDNSLDFSEGCQSAKYLNDDLEEDDKYFEYKKDKVRIRAKASPKHPPKVYNLDKSLLKTEQEIGVISNGSIVNVLVRPYCFGDQAKYFAWELKFAKAEADLDSAKKSKEAKKIAAAKKAYSKVIESKPIFGITLGLHSVQYLKPGQGTAAADSVAAEMLDDTEISAEDLDLDDSSEEESLEEGLEEDAEESLDLSEDEEEDEEVLL